MTVMHKYKVFIDGQSGTTGLQIRQRLCNHPQIEIVNIEDDKRKDTERKRQIMSSVDVSILCLPDDAARESAALALESGCRVLDASTAHRTLDNWVYGLPEMAPQQRQKIASAQCVANPGCYPTGIVLLLRPLVELNLLAADVVWGINAVSGYTGGGNKLIEEYQQGGAAFAAYGLGLNHKHLPEIKKWACLNQTPIFQPATGDFAQGMLIFIPVVHSGAASGEQIHGALSDYYQNEAFISVEAFNETDKATAPYLTPLGMDGSNQVKIYVFSSTETGQTLLAAKLDNLGKGASGAAVQNLNIMLGLDERLCTELVS